MISKMLIAVLIGVALTGAAGIAAFTILNDDNEDGTSDTDDNPDTVYVEGYHVILPEKHVGYTISASPMTVPDGGRCTISYSLNTGHVDDELVITINDNPIRPNGIGQIFIDDVHSDLMVKVSGVYDMREYKIIVPEEQIGYVLTTSVDRLHHGQTYTLEYELMPGYKEIPGQFKISINGEVNIDLRNGKAEITDVRAQHDLTVEGIEAIEYNITAGRNTLLEVNGVVSHTATINDTIVPIMMDGSPLPSTYHSYVPNTATKTENGYRITANTVFPSVIKIMVGENIRANGHNEGEDFTLCANDTVRISAESGYSIPDSFDDKLPNGSRISSSVRDYRFSSDVILPSIYKITYMEFDKNMIFFETGGNRVPIPIELPAKRGYVFNGWDTKESIVKNDLTIGASWNLETFSISFGNNINYTINKKPYIEPNFFNLTIEDEIKIKCAEGYDFPNNYIPLDSVIKLSDDTYRVYGDTTFNSVYYVNYRDENSNLSVKFYYESGSSHYLINPAMEYNSPFNLEFDDGDRSKAHFIGWIDSKEKMYYGGPINIDQNYILYPLWEFMLPNYKYGFTD